MIEAMSSLLEATFNMTLKSHFDQYVKSFKRPTDFGDFFVRFSWFSPQACIVLRLLYLRICGSTTESGAQPIYVSFSGRDSVSCGSPASKPCRTISHAITRISGKGGAIFINGLNPNHTYHECAEKPRKAAHITYSLTMSGYLGSPRIGCREASGYGEMTLFVFSLQQANATQAITLSNLTLLNGVININSAALNIKTVTFVNALVRTVECHSLTLHINSSSFSRNVPCREEEDCATVTDTMFVCGHIVAYIANSLFWDTNIMLSATKWASINATQNVFGQRLPYETGTGGMNVSFPSHDGGFVYVEDCVFENQRHYDPVLSAINIESAALRIESLQNGPDHNATARVTILNCVFRNNERGLSVSRPFSHIEVQRCLFENNLCMHAASAIRLAIGEGAVITIEDTHFNHNSAGKTSHKDDHGRFEIINDEVVVNGEKYKGQITLMGKGGAIRIQRGILHIQNCSFVNNTARLLGGAIYVDRGCQLHISDSYFENSHNHDHSLQGDVLYSSGFVTIKQSNFQVVTANNHVPILRHSGDYWSMEVRSLWFQCPRGHRLLTINSTSHQICNSVGLKRSHKLDQMSYYCKTCSNGKYSLDHGSLNYKFLDNSSNYFTLLINGSSPFQFHSVDYAYGDISCYDCPYGAVCENGIDAMPNFWGYRDGKFLQFQHCPEDYCCSGDSCASIHSCAAFREGTLCGQCKENYSEVLFSSKCVPNHTCTNMWIYGFTGCIGFFYALFLVYQKDIIDNLGKWVFATPSASSKSLPVLLSSCLTRNAAVKRNLASEEGLVSDSLPLERCSSAEQKPEDDSSVVSNNCIEEASTCTSDTNPEQPRADARFLIILFYYFQDALLLHVKTTFSTVNNKAERQIKAFLLSLFRFRLDFYFFLGDICILPNLTPIRKMLLKMLIVPYILLVFGIFYYTYLCCSTYRRRNKRVTLARTGSFRKHILHIQGRLETFSSKLASGFTLAMLFSYQQLATASFSLVNCVQVGNKSVLFIDGNNECFESWQWFILAYVFLSVALFSPVLMFGPPLLQHKHISMRQFFFACVIPFPFLVYWLRFFATCKKMAPPSERTERKELSPAATKVLQILQGPFKECTSPYLIGHICWSGFLMLRRLFLFLCYTFINSVLIRLLCMMSVCFTMLLHHVYIQPYKSKGGNLAGTLSATALVIISGINLLRACFEAAEYFPKGPIKVLMQVCDQLENAFLLWFPILGIGIIVAVISARALYSVIVRCSESCKT